MWIQIVTIHVKIVHGSMLKNGALRGAYFKVYVLQAFLIKLIQIVVVHAKILA